MFVILLGCVGRKAISSPIMTDYKIQTRHIRSVRVHTQFWKLVVSGMHKAKWSSRYFWENDTSDFYTLNSNISKNSMLEIHLKRCCNLKVDIWLEAFWYFLIHFQKDMVYFFFTDSILYIFQIVSWLYLCILPYNFDVWMEWDTGTGRKCALRRMLLAAS